MALSTSTDVYVTGACVSTDNGEAHLGGHAMWHELNS